MKYIRFIIKRYLFAVIALAFVIIYWLSASKLPEESIVFPRIITYIIIPLFIWVFIQSIVEFQKLKKDTSIPEEEKWDCTLNLTKPKLVIIGATILYIALIPIVGYVVTTALYVAGLSFYLGNRSPIKLILFTGILIAILYVIFAVWLRIRLPHGFLF